MRLPRFTRRRAGLAVMAFAALFVFAACTEDVNPDGGWSSPVHSGDFIYLGNTDGQMVRAFADSGNLDVPWRFPASGDVGKVYGDPVIVDGIVYGTGFNCAGNNCQGEVYAVEEGSMASAWAAGPYEVNTKFVGTVALGEGILVVGTSAVDEEPDPKGYLLALDPRADTGLPGAQQAPARELWRLPVDGAVWGTPAIADNTAYFGTMSGTVYAVDLSDLPEYQSDVEARILWKFSADGAVAGNVLLEDGRLYFGSFDNNVYALDIETRAASPEGSDLAPSSEWSFDTGGWVWAEPLSHEGALYVASLNGRVFALNPQDGQPLWPEPAIVGEKTVARPAVIGNTRGPSLAVPSGDGDVFIVVLANGQVAGRFSTGGNGVYSRPAAVGDDRLFVHSVNGQLRVFNTVNLSQVSCIEPRGDGGAC